MPKLFVNAPLVLLLSMLSYQSVSQSLAPDSSSPAAYKNALAFYSQSLTEELHLFKGREDKGYSMEFVEGTPYFLSNNWSKGTLKYDGKMYENVSLSYDVVEDEVQCQYFDKRSRIKLDKKKVAGFSIMGHHFIHLSDSSIASGLVSGFYDELYNGGVSLLVKRTKNIQTSIKQSGLETKVFSKDHYYLKKGNTFFVVRNKKSFLRNLSDKRKDLQQYIRQSGLNFKKDFENAMIQTLLHYDQLIHM